MQAEEQVKMKCFYLLKVINLDDKTSTVHGSIILGAVEQR